jgi:hypothetical protein
VFSNEEALSQKPVDLKSINNLKLFKRRNKGFYEKNKKKPGLFTMSSARINQNH